MPIGPDTEYFDLDEFGWDQLSRTKKIIVVVKFDIFGGLGSKVPGEDKLAYIDISISYGKSSTSYPCN